MATANHVLLRRITVTDPVSSIVFDSIPQTGYTDLKFVVSSRVNSGGPNDVKIQFNSDTTVGNYSVKQIQGNGSSASSGNGEQQTATSTGSGDTASTFATSEIYIPNYTSSNAKTHATDTVTENNGTTAYATLRAGRWTGTAAISTITFSHNGAVSWAVGSSFSLYGIADVNTTPLTAPKADGGDVVRTDGTYWYHEFYSAGVFKPQLNLSCDYLVIAGGGGGGGGYGAGGGAGGYLTASNYSMSATSYPVTVGSGGAGGSSTSGVAGTNSTLGSIVAYGGGFGAGPNTPGSRPGGAGGSGGGGGYASGTAGAATPSGQGYPGGTGPAGFYGGAGGGGAGGPGQVGASQANCVGGAGLSSSITGTAVTRASGGSGYSAAATTGGGGSGNGGTIHGTAYTGGGGGTENNGPTASGGNGGSGIVIIRYTVA